MWVLQVLPKFFLVEYFVFQLLATMFVIADFIFSILNWFVL